MMRRVLIAGVALSGAVVITAAQEPARTHELPLAPQHVHWGHFDAGVKPAVRIRSGDRVRVETMVARGLERLKLAGVPDAEIPASMRAVESAVRDRGPGPHPMTGPISVEGAEPGDSLEVRILAIDFLHPYGVAAFSPGGGVLPSDFPYAHQRLLRWQAGARDVEFRPGVRLPLAPFFGTIGVAPPPLSGRISTMAPGWHGGNLDNKDLTPGSVLFLPVHVQGGLLSLGDGHAMQGDGEVTGAALETSLVGTIEIHLRKGQRLRWPRAETQTHYMTMGLDPDLDEAVRLATREMVDYLVAEKRLSRDDAYILCSLAANLRVTQAVDGTKGIHALIAKSIFK
jgi:acetamidase/formamidase